MTRINRVNEASTLAGRSSRTAPKVVVLMGGPSAEREVSLSSGRECAQALRQAGYEVTELDAGRDLPARLAEIAPDVVFNALHGRWGEDGCVQGLLEWLGIPYTHSGVLASALAMDKSRTKQLFREAGLPVVESVIAVADEVRARHVLPPPYVVKPNNEGSSVGVYLVHEAADAPPQLSDQMPARVMVETYAPGREMTVAVLGDRALGVTEIITTGWYDYDAKYKPGGSRHVIPAEIPEDIAQACRDYAVRAHELLGCQGLSRTDFRWDDSRGLAGLIILETNTQPGMTPTSLAPEQAAHAGMDFPALCRWIVEEALCRD
ncbi:D-alanine--D-alanine ligase [Paracoccus lutimaris]|uniref:D-alanine--D-alanine ligase n=1 Tax=Paracoccus lutimaris TaxID=1490030 RepID=A0A368YJR5_9RHOB|nr:D-alanine--D-alanine ligase [Paracoccus lutimaris]